MPFLGRFDHTIDEKGRISIPAPYRDELAKQDTSQVILAPHPAGDGVGVLWAFPPSVWERDVKGRLGNRSPFDPAMIQFKRDIVQRSWGCTLDGNGRILIPQELRNFAQLKRDVVLAAMDDWFELWSADQYHLYQGGGEGGSDSLAVDPKLWERL